MHTVSPLILTFPLLSQKANSFVWNLYIFNLINISFREKLTIQLTIAICLLSVQKVIVRLFRQIVSEE